MRRSRENRDGRRTGEGVAFQDSQELVVKGCENDTKAQAVREIVNRGINGAVKRELEPTSPPKTTSQRHVCVGQRAALCVFMSNVDIDHLVLQG